MRYYFWTYISIIIIYWISLIWRYYGDYPASYLLGWALVWPIDFFQWIF